MQLQGRNVLVLGLGATGLSMARWLARQGARVRVADSRNDPPNASQLRAELPDARLDTGPFRSASFDAIDLVAVSPGIALSEPALKQALDDGLPVVGDVELFAHAKDAASRVIAVTGSNGKSTVTTMAGSMCKAAGARTVVAGNIGLPVLDALSEATQAEIYVLELSSFQLETTCSLDPAAATVLNVSEDHLDRYDGMQSYARAKARIFQGSGAQVLNREDGWSMGMRLPDRQVVTFGLNAPQGSRDWGIVSDASGAFLTQGGRRVMALSELGVPGLHNAANALAALALCTTLGLPESPMVGALRAFRGLPHRLQPVAVCGEVTFYDDSKGTNVGAAVAALSGLGRTSVLIAGGEGKGQDFTPLAQAVQQHARAVVLIGRDRDRIRAALAASGVALMAADTLEDAVGIAYAAAMPGDAVLLSPACASFDMFRDYRHRGEAFARISRALAQRSGGRH
ncbi:MAG: UDP-N-acetylmuramoyl-L-alanine--D-glutamate ligase [Betaproteobacteria bacterium]|nr:UDP-N-acetylmuramoyl-L-alanine--D-glutamate ligase [Betaproteobacteria bacterium]